MKEETIRNGFFLNLKELQKFYERHRDSIKLINIQLSENGKYCIFYIA